MRDIDPEKVDDFLVLFLPDLAKKYGDRKGIDPDVLPYCVELVTDEFSNLGPEEIELAYRLYYTGRTMAQGAEMYHGQFNAANMSKVLSAYVRVRKKFLANYEKEREEPEISPEEKEQREQRWLEDMRAEIDRERLNLESWKDVPGTWFEACIDAGIFQKPVDSQWINIMIEKAETAAKVELRKEAEEEIQNCYSVMAGVLKRRDFHHKEADRITWRGAEIFKKMYVFHMLCEVKIYELLKTLGQWIKP